MTIESWPFGFALIVDSHWIVARSPGDPHKWRFGPLWTFICFSPPHYTTLYYTTSTIHHTIPNHHKTRFTALYYVKMECTVLYYNTTSTPHRTTEPDARNTKLGTLQCSVVFNVGNSLVLVVTLVASIGDDITPAALVVAEHRRRKDGVAAELLWLNVFR